MHVPFFVFDPHVNKYIYVRESVEKLNAFTVINTTRYT